MKEAMYLFLGVIGILIAATGMAWGLSSVLPPQGGDVLIVGGAIGMAVCFLFVWFVKNALSRLTWLATMSYVSLLVGVDVHIAFHKAFGQPLAIKAFLMAIFVTFLITALLRKNFNENPGK